MAERFDVDKAIFNFATGSDIELGVKKKIQVTKSDGSVVTVKMQKKKVATKATTNLYKWAKDRFKKKKDKSDDDDDIYEIPNTDDMGLNETGLYRGISQLPTENPFLREAVHQNRLPFMKLLQPQKSTSCTELPIPDRSRSSHARNIPNYTARKSTATEMLSPFDRPILTPPIISRSAPLLSSMSDVESKYDEDQTEHIYLELGSQVRQSSDDELYVIPNLQSKETHVSSTYQNSTCDDYEDSPVRLSQTSIRTPAVERNLLIGSGISIKLVTDEEVDDYNDEYTIISKDDGEEEDEIVCPFHYTKMRPRSKVESQYAPIETKGNYGFFSDRMSSIDSTGYQSDDDRLSYLTDLHKELQIQHPNPPARTDDASEIMSPAKGINNQDNEQEDSLRSSDNSTFDSMDSEEDRLKYLTNLHSDMEKGEGGYCTFSWNAHVPFQNEAGYLNIPCDGLFSEQKFTNDAKRAEAAIQSEVVTNEYVDITKNL
ncbi:uncharacterized protein [Amphiura filiformis]|uniref:uncharacterized protein n=1 Tax=Amphiura filiformis TaxID=82378 RepID=UPI003B2218B3